MRNTSTRCNPTDVAAHVRAMEPALPGICISLLSFKDRNNASFRSLYKGGGNVLPEG